MGLVVGYIIVSRVQVAEGNGGQGVVGALMGQRGCLEGLWATLRQAVASRLEAS